MRDQLNTIAGYTIQIQRLNHKIKIMCLERININISIRFGLAGNLRRINEDDNTLFNFTISTRMHMGIAMFQIGLPFLHLP